MYNRDIRIIVSLCLAQGENMSQAASDNHFLNTKSQSRFAEGKYREANITVGINILYPPCTVNRKRQEKN
jgi:hypothetical protein